MGAGQDVALSFHALWGTPLSHTSMYLQTQKLSEPCCLGFLWRFRYLGMVDWIIGYRLLTQSPASPVFPWVSEDGAKSCNPLITWLVMRWQPASILKVSS